MAKQHRSDINVNVILDKNKIPEKLQWSAKDGGIENMDSKAIFMSVWDHKAKEALRIDLWTKDMPLDEMKIFVQDYSNVGTAQKDINQMSEEEIDRELNIK